MNEGNIYQFPGKKEGKTSATETHRASAEVIPLFPEEQKVAEESLELNGTVVTALRQKVAEITEKYPFLMTPVMLKEAEEATSKFTRKDIIRIINSFHPGALEDVKAPMYKALINRIELRFTDE